MRNIHCVVQVLDLILDASGEKWQLRTFQKSGKSFTNKIGVSVPVQRENENRQLVDRLQTLEYCLRTVSGLDYPSVPFPANW